MITIRIVRLQRHSRRCPARASSSTARRRPPTPRWSQRQSKKNGSTLVGCRHLRGRVLRRDALLRRQRCRALRCGDDRRPPGLTQGVARRINHPTNQETQEDADGARHFPERRNRRRYGCLKPSRPRERAGQDAGLRHLRSTCTSRKTPIAWPEFSRHLPGRKPMDLTRDVVSATNSGCEILIGPNTQRQVKPGTLCASLPH